ncbi:MAG: epimerase [Ignavibacteria bacterium]|nr:epimerase [Ignavibacteria bacterium]
MKIRVIIFGASGMVGEGVLLKALEHEKVESVLVIGRRPCRVMHPKLTEILHNDFFNFTSIEEKLKGYDACFFCLGVSSVGMSEADYAKITYDLTMHTATILAKLNPSMTFCYVSGTGTDSSEKGRIMWARVKGKTENDLAKLPFKSVYSFRPGLLKPVDGQKNVKRIFKIVAAPYPLWKMLFPGSVSTLEDVGLAMINATMNGYSKNILENKDIAELANMNVCNHD